MKCVYNMGTTVNTEPTVQNVVNNDKSLSVIPMYCTIDPSIVSETTDVKFNHAITKLYVVPSLPTGQCFDT